MDSCNVNVNGVFFSNWVKDEVRNLDEKLAKKLLFDNKDFVLESDVVKVEKVTKASSVNFDLNGDGKFDAVDKSIAGKVLNKKN